MKDGDREQIKNDDRKRMRNGGKDG